MTVLIRENRRAEMVHQPVTRQARLAVPRGIVPTHPDGTFHTYNAVRINEMTALWPYDELRTRCIDGAKSWVARQARLGDELLTPESDVKVYGPYRSRAGTYGNTGKPKVTAYGEDEDFNDDLADFVLEATFIQTRNLVVQTKETA